MVLGENFLSAFAKRLSLLVDRLEQCDDQLSQSVIKGTVVRLLQIAAVVQEDIAKREDIEQYCQRLNEFILRIQTAFYCLPLTSSGESCVEKLIKRKNNISRQRKKLYKIHLRKVRRRRKLRETDRNRAILKYLQPSFPVFASTWPHFLRQVSICRSRS